VDPAEFEAKREELSIVRVALAEGFVLWRNSPLGYGLKTGPSG
jgi:hypothetical protein